MPLIALIAFSCSKHDGGASTKPVLTTTAITNIKDSSASSGGNITSDGGSPIAGRGIIWDTSANFTTQNNWQTFDGAGTGNFTSSLTGLIPGTKYYVRAFATNTVGVAYGNVITFTTTFVPSKYTVTTLAGNGSVGSAEGNGNSASFNGPDGVCADLLGNVYVADYGNKKIRKISPDGTVSTLAPTDGSPSDVAVDANGYVYVAEQSLKILKITPAGSVTVFAGSGSQGSKDSTGIYASFTNPITLDIDASGNLYVGDRFVVRMISPAGVVTTPSNLNGNLPHLPNVIAVAVDKMGNVYSTDGFIIRKTDPSGVGSFIAGGQGSADGIGILAGFNSITELKTDEAGNIYAADLLNNRIRLITPAGLVTTLAGTGAAGAADGNAASATFKGPVGLAIDATGHIYVADASNNKIRKIAQ